MPDSDATRFFNDIYYATSKKVLGFITAKCSNVSDISDIFQDTYTEVYAAVSRRTVKCITNQEAFVIKIARQKLWKYYSLTDRLKHILPMHEQDDNGEEFIPADREADSFCIDDKIADDMLLDEIRGILARKPQNVQKIFRMFYALDMTIPEISKLLGMSQSNVKHKLYRTLNELRNLYK